MRRSLSLEAAPAGTPAWRWRDPFALATAALIIFFLVCAAVLWVVGDGTYFVKRMTESHNILLVAANVHDPLSFILQDVAASPDPAAHPFWYIHHPNLLAKIVSLILGAFGLGLEGQTAAMLVLNAAGLVLVASAFRTVSAAAAVGALVAAVTSYGAFHYSAGDLCRGPLYPLVWLLLFALLRNRRLDALGWNLAVAATMVAAVLSDWGLAVFVVAFACCVATLGRGSVPWRWIGLWVAVPAAAALVVYEAAVVAAVGWDFFLLDLKVTYFGRLGAGTFVDYSHLLQTYRDNDVVVWPPQGHGTDTLLDLVAVLTITPLLNTGPAWLLLMPLVVWALVRTARRLRLGTAAWAVIAAAALTSVIGVLPLAVLALPLVIIGIALARVPMATPIQRLTGLTASTVLALAAAAAAFPSFTMSFTISGGRPPLPLLEMAAAALLAELVLSGALTRLLKELAHGKRPQLARAARPFLVTLATVLVVTAVTIALGEPSFFGTPRILAMGLAAALAGSVLIVAVEGRAYVIRMAADGSQPADHSMSGMLRRWLWAGLLIGLTALLAMHKSANPVLLGRYSLSYGALLGTVAVSALAAAVLAAWPGIAQSLWTGLRTASGLGRGEGRGHGAAQMVSAVAVALVVAQIFWLGIAAGAQPPQPIPYAHELEKPAYRGRSFATTSYEGLVWYSTRGWAYMPPANPPDPGPIGPRFRHFGDWRNNAKYGRPEFFLCDNTGTAYVRPGMRADSTQPADLVCKGSCTCRDVVAQLAARGHKVEVDHPDYAIVRFRW